MHVFSLGRGLEVPQDMWCELCLPHQATGAAQGQLAPALQPLDSCSLLLCAPRHVPTEPYPTPELSSWGSQLWSEDSWHWPHIWPSLWK